MIASIEVKVNVDGDVDKALSALEEFGTETEKRHIWFAEDRLGVSDGKLSLLDAGVSVRFRSGDGPDEVDALLPPATFGDFEAPMCAVPALGQHTHALLIESGTTTDRADDAIARGVALQANNFQLLRGTSCWPDARLSSPEEHKASGWRSPHDSPQR